MGKNGIEWDRRAWDGMGCGKVEGKVGLGEQGWAGMDGWGRMGWSGVEAGGMAQGELEWDGMDGWEWMGGKEWGGMGRSEMIWVTTVIPYIIDGCPVWLHGSEGGPGLQVPVSDCDGMKLDGMEWHEVGWDGMARD